MINGKRVIGVIPARGGSKGLPGKNIKLINGKPLLHWTVEVANKSTFLDDVIVSTDSEEIAKIAMDAGGSAPFLRPAELASDTATSVDVVLHAIDFLQNKNDVTYDIAVLLEPTSPLREESDIDNIIQSLVRAHDELDGVVSIGETSCHPSLVKKIAKEKIMPFSASIASESRRQELEHAYFPYGVGYAIKVPFLREHKSFYPEKCGYFIVQRYQCYEIDDYFDFLCVESIMKDRVRQI